MLFWPLPQRKRMDKFTKKKRSEIMSRVRSKDTSPEKKVRSLVHGMGFRYRLHDRNLPGSPDLVFVSRRKVIFVHGCFWHGHKKCKRAALPTSNRLFWEEKIGRNKNRDMRVQKDLCKLGWSVMVLWTCQLKDLDRIAKQIVRFLKPQQHNGY